MNFTRLEAEVYNLRKAITKEIKINKKLREEIEILKQAQLVPYNNETIIPNIIYGDPVIIRN